MARIDAKEASARAMAEYDSNRDGYLDVTELERCPGLKSVLAPFDRDKDGRLSQAEIEEGLTSIQDGQVVLAEVTCKVTLDGKPLAGASVVVEPESFLQSYIKPAKGTTNEQGRASMQIDGAARPGCHIGLYRVRISKVGDEGRDIVPARYNSQTILGLGAGSRVGPRGSGVYSFSLTAP